MKRRSPRPWYLSAEAGVYWLAGVGLLLVAAGLAGIIQVVQAADPSLPEAASPGIATHTHTPTATLTPTPFRPVSPTQTVLPPTPLPATATQPPAPHFAARLLEDSAGQTRLEINPGPAVNQGKPIQLDFLPGPDCAFGSGAACVSRHQRGDLLLLTIHSGLGGQAESFRRAVEGIGLDSALFSLNRIHENLIALRGAPVRLTSGGQTQDNLELVGVARIPPERVAEYFSLPGDDALELAALYDPVVRAALDAGEELLAFEVCGWSVPGEAAPSGISPTSASIYLGFIRDH